MPNDAFDPALSPLANDYQILTELRRSSRSRTLLARHLLLNRDVTITVTPPGVAGPDALASFDRDVERLKTARHPNVIPVIEGRRLDDGSYAVVRARVRGSTLDQLVSAVGGIPLNRVSSTLQQVRSALDWARGNGISNRDVGHEDLIFQQGSGRVLLAFEPDADFSTGATTAAASCHDARVIGRLAWEMLAGQPFDANAVGALGTIRRDLSPDIVARTQALVNCTPAATSTTADAGAYIALLSGGAVIDTPSAFAAAPGRSKIDVAAPTPLYTEPVGRAATPVAAEPAVVVNKQGWGFGARLATAVAIVAAIAIVAMLFINRGGTPQVDRTASASTAPATGEAAGDVALHADSVAVPPPAPAAVPQHFDTVPQMPAAGGAMVPPVTRAHEPVQTTTPMVMMPSPVPPSTASTPSAPSAPAPAPVASAATPAEGVCASPSADDQHRCLMDAIDRNDVELNAVYKRLIAALRARAGIADADPASVQQLRSAEHDWVDARDRACRDVGSGALWATDRAQCFAQQSADRTRQLQAQLDALPPS